MSGHIPEDELALYAFDPAAAGEERRARIERHVDECAECRATHDFFIVAEADLMDAETWEPIAGSATRASLMEHAARIEAEDAHAEEILRPYLANPASAAWEALASRRAFRTGGVVRRLNAHAHGICEADPLAALTYADAAAAIAEALPDDAYSAGAVNQLRGTASKERANALMLLGRFPAAHEALDRAERFFRRTMNNGLGLSMVALVRAGVLYEQQRYDEAMAAAERAERGFAHAGDEKRRMDAVLLRASIMMETGDATGALRLYRQIIDYGERTNNLRAVARGSYACGHAEVDLGNLAEASLHFHRALVLFREVGPEPDRVATEWGIARIVLKSGKPHDAVRRLRIVQREFEARGMITDAALVGLDVAEALLALGQPQQIVPLAQHLFGVFKEAGMLTGALSAIAYMKEAAAAKRLTIDDVEVIRGFLRRAERQPSLAFAPAPRQP